MRIAGELADLYSELQTFPGDEHHGALVEKHMAEVKAKRTRWSNAGIPWESVVEVGERIVVRESR